MVDWSARVIRLTVKGGKPHTIPITSEVREILWPLQALRAPSDPMAVFTFVAERTRFGRVRGQRYPITYNGLQRRWIADRDKSGIKDFRWHDIRHTAATRTLRAGKNLRAVQRLLGHENIATTTKYAHATLDDVREAMESAAARKHAVGGTLHG